MQTCLSDDRPVWSLLFGIFLLTIGTWHLFLLYSRLRVEFDMLAWLFLLAILVNYGFALYTLRYGVSHRSERVQKLFEPRWLADDRE